MSTFSSIAERLLALAADAMLLITMSDAGYMDSKKKIWIHISLITKFMCVCIAVLVSYDSFVAWFSRLRTRNLSRLVFSFVMILLWKRNDRGIGGVQKAKPIREECVENWNCLMRPLVTRDWSKVLRVHSHMKTSKSTCALSYCNPFLPADDWMHWWWYRQVPSQDFA